MQIIRTLVFFAFILCAFGSVYAQTAGLNLGRRLCDETDLVTMLAKSPRNVVVIYLANDRMDRDRKSDGDFGFFTNTISDAVFQSRSRGEVKSAEIFQRVLDVCLADDNAFQTSIDQDLLGLRNLAERSPFHSLIAITNSTNEMTWGMKDREHVHQSFLYAQYWKSLADYSLIQIDHQLYVPNLNHNHPFAQRECIVDSLNQVISSCVKEAEGRDVSFLPSFVIIVRDRGTRNFALAPFSFQKLSEIATADHLQQIARESAQISAENDLQLVQEVQQRIHHLFDVGQSRTKTSHLNQLGMEKTDLLISLANLNYHRCDVPIIAMLSGQSALELSDETQSDNFLLESLLTKSDGNDFQWGRPLDQQIIESYSQLKASNLGLLFTTNGYRLDHRFVDFAKIVSELPEYKYRSTKPITLILERMKAASLDDESPDSRLID